MALLEAPLVEKQDVAFEFVHLSLEACVSLRSSFMYSLSEDKPVSTMYRDNKIGSPEWAPKLVQFKGATSHVASSYIQ